MTNRHRIGAALAAAITAACLVGCGQDGTANASSGSGPTTAGGGVQPGDPGMTNGSSTSGGGPPPATPRVPVAPTGGQYPQQPKPPPIPDNLFDRAGGTSTWDGALSSLYRVCEEDDSIRETFSVADCRVAADYLITSSKLVVVVGPDPSLGEDKHCTFRWNGADNSIEILSDGTDDCADTLVRTRPKPGQKPPTDETTTPTADEGSPTESTTDPESPTTEPTG